MPLVLIKRNCLYQLPHIYVHISHFRLHFARFVPFFFSMIVCCCWCCWRCCCRKKEPNGNSACCSILSRMEFLWQLPYFQLVRHFMLWNELRKAVLKKQKIYRHWNPEGMPLLTIIRTTELVNSQSWHMNEIRKALDKTVLARVCRMSFICQY